MPLSQDPEEYFRPPGGLLTFDMHLGDLINQSVPYQQEANPANSPAKSMKLDDTKTGHFNLVIAQLQQVGLATDVHANRHTCHVSMLHMYELIDTCNGGHIRYMRMCCKTSYRKQQGKKWAACQLQKTAGAGG